MGLGLLEGVPAGLLAELVVGRSGDSSSSSDGSGDDDDDEPPAKKSRKKKSKKPKTSREWADEEESE